MIEVILGVVLWCCTSNSLGERSTKIWLIVSNGMSFSHSHPSVEFNDTSTLCNRASIHIVQLMPAHN